MLKLTNVSKKYKNSDVYSVKDLTFEVKDGEIFGFLGKNGAGKSTTIKSITGIIPFDGGTIEICGHDIKKEPITCKLNIGYVPDNHAVYENLTGKEYVNYIANLYKVEKELEAFDKLKFAIYLNNEAIASAPSSKSIMSSGRFIPWFFKS